MTISHFWFQSGRHSLLAHLHAASAKVCARSLGVLIAPSFGIEDVVAHRALRNLAVTLSENGFPVLRFDLPGTGDSSGGAFDHGLFDEWVASIDNAAQQLRICASVQDVAVIGLRLGALLALQATRRGAAVADLVLWGPVITGRALLREFVMMDKLESIPSPDVPETKDPEGTLQLVGFKLSAETRQAVTAVDFSNIPPMSGRRVMLLSRDDLAEDGKLMDALDKAACSVERLRGSGYSSMMVAPHESVAPTASFALISDFLIRSHNAKLAVGRIPSESPTGSVVPDGRQQSEVRIDNGVSESSLVLKTEEGNSFGILAQPAKAYSSDTLLLLLNAGAVRHIGPNRMWVEVARRWARHGIPSYRFDLMGVGESDGMPPSNSLGLYGGPYSQQIADTIRALKEGGPARQFIAIGLCSGAYWAFQSAVAHSEIRSAVLLNPRLFFADPEVDRRRALRQMRTSASDSGAWKRLVRGEVNLTRLKMAADATLRSVFDRSGDKDHYQISPVEMAMALKRIEEFGTRLTFVFSEGEPLLQEMEEEGQLPPHDHPRLKCIRIANSSHTFHQPWAQETIHGIIDREIETVLKQHDSLQRGVHCGPTPPLSAGFVAT